MINYIKLIIEIKNNFIHELFGLREVKKLILKLKRIFNLTYKKTKINK